MNDEGTGLLAIGTAVGRTTRLDRAPAPPHAEGFAWVVAALRARTDS
ncbi:hypothetical protein [Streptomyces sp. NPDC046976]